MLVDEPKLPMKMVSIVRVLGWRWTPCVALVMGSLAFVALAFAIIPERIGPVAARSPAPGDDTPFGVRSSSHGSRDTRPEVQAALMSPALPAAPAPQPAPLSADRSGNRSAVESLFPSTPPIQLPVAPPDPSPPPPPEPPPPAAPSATIYTLPSAPAPVQPPENAGDAESPPPVIGPENHP